MPLGMIEKLPPLALVVVIIHPLPPVVVQNNGTRNEPRDWQTIQVPFVSSPSSVDGGGSRGPGCPGGSLFVDAFSDCCSL